MTWSPRRRFAALFVAALAALAGTTAAPRADQPPEALPRRPEAASPVVLMLHSYDVSSEWTLGMARGLREALAEAGHRLDVRSEFLDLRHDNRPVYREALHAMLRTKYAAVEPRLIVTTDDAALEFLLDHPDLMGDVPVVFGGVNNDRLASRVPRAQVAGVREAFRIDSVLDVALRLRPGTRRVILLTDDTLLGESVRGTFRKAVKARAPVSLLEMSTADLTLEQMIMRVRAESGPRDLVVATALAHDRTGHYFQSSVALGRVAAASRAPVLAIGMNQKAGGVLAGTLHTGEEHGGRMARLAVRLLEGVPASSIPIEHDDTTLLAFDAMELSRWQIREAALPADAVVFNRPASFYRANKAAIWLGAGFMLAQSLIIGGLVVNVRRRRRAEHRLAEHAETLADQAAALASTNVKLEAAIASLRGEQATRQQAEQHLRQAQKMEAVGRLAGGVAHDFNNLLTIIIGYCALLLEEPPPEPAQREGLTQIRRASEQAAALTQNLLAFSRRQVSAPAVVDVASAIGALEPMLRRFCGEAIASSLTLDPDTGCVELGEGQFEQILINLVINARDAMPQGGRLLVGSRRATLTASSLPTPDLRPGEYALVTVTDTGSGMDDETRARVFEPFFTTKEVGQGTGLGLATVYGIVTQHGGHVAVSSEPGRGATFSVWLPLTSSGTPPASEGARRASAPPRCTVLVVEDAPQVRTLVCLVLRQAGYDVLEAGGGDEALGLVTTHPGPIDLLLTDVVMPGADGFTVARRCREVRPGLAVAYVSGYAEPGRHPDAPPDESTLLLRKPFMPDDLLSHVREVLQAAHSPAGATPRA